jgi:hypothetical protein
MVPPTGDVMKAMPTVLSQRLLRIMLVVIVVAAVTAGCGGSSEPTSGSPASDGDVTMPSTVSPAGNVVGDVVQLTPGEVGMEDRGVDVSLRKCTLVAAGVLRLEGEIDTPADFEPGSVDLNLYTIVADMVMSQPIRVEVSGPGSFAVDVPRWSQDAVPDSGFIELEPARDLVSSCALAAGRYEGSAVTLQIGEPTFPDEPAGSIQALGAGAHLGDTSDPRLLYAYLSSLKWELPFEVIWAPDPASGIVVSKLDDYRDPAEPCPRMSLEIGLDGEVVAIQQELGCYPGAGNPFEPSALDTREPIAGSDRFTWWDSEGHRFAGLVDGDLTISVRGTSETAVARVTAALGAYANVYVREVTNNPRVNADIDEALQPLLAANHMVERARFEYRQAQLVIVVESEPDPTAALGYVVADLTANGWYVPDFINSKTPGWSSCVDGMGAGDSQGGFDFFGVRDPSWVLEIDNGDGWQRPPATNGISFFPFGPDEQLISHMLSTQFRVVTQDGEAVPECLSP